MLIKDVSLDKIKRLLSSVDPDLEISSISFVNDDYVLSFTKSLSNVQYVQNEVLMAELKQLIKKADEAYSKILDNEKEREIP